MTMVLSFIFAASSVLGLITLLWMGLRAAWWRPRVLRRWFEKQGIPCLPYRFLVGNLTEMSQMANEARSTTLDLHAHGQLGPRILPHFYHFKNVYGKSLLLLLPQRVLDNFVMFSYDPVHES
jgi:hypothetical protein